MGERVNIGIFISAEDKEIAAWFNLLNRNRRSHSKWVRALLAAYALDKRLSIGTINSAAANQLNHPDSDEQGNPPKKLRYGWNVRGPDKEFVVGSTINIGFTKDEIFPVIEEIWKNGHKRSTFIKALIRKNLHRADQDIPPKEEDRQAIWSKYLVFANSKMLSRTDSPKSPTTSEGDKIVRHDTQPTQQEVLNQEQPGPPDPKPATLSEFQNSSPSSGVAASKSPKAWNPLLDQI